MGSRCSTPAPGNSKPPPMPSTAGWRKANCKARIDRVLPLSQAAEAHRLQEESTIQKTGALAGKIVLKP